VLFEPNKSSFLRRFGVVAHFGGEKRCGDSSVPGLSGIKRSGRFKVVSLRLGDPSVPGLSGIKRSGRFEVVALRLGDPSVPGLSGIKRGNSGMGSFEADTLDFCPADGLLNGVLGGGSGFFLARRRFEDVGG
jgi:hypothetical protein